jgi:hypothetical protein
MAERDPDKVSRFATVDRINMPEPKAIRSFRIYSVIQSLLYLAFAIFCFFAFPAENEIDKRGARIGAALQLVVALGFFGAWLLPRFVRPQPWLWTYNLVVLWIGSLNIFMLPASIPLQRNWVKPETKEFFGKS